MTWKKLKRKFIQKKKKKENAILRQQVTAASRNCEVFICRKIYFHEECFILAEKTQFAFIRNCAKRRHVTRTRLKMPHKTVRKILHLIKVFHWHISRLIFCRNTNLFVLWIYKPICIVEILTYLFCQSLCLKKNSLPTKREKFA